MVSTGDPSRLDRIEALQERTQRQVDANSEALQRLIAIHIEAEERNRGEAARFQEFQRTTNAALERIDRVLDYLLRSQGGNT